MQNWASKFVLGCLAVTCAGPSHATQPQTVHVHDRLFARTDDSLLILRQITDNHGRYTSLQTDTLLVTCSLTDGRDTHVQPVERVVEFVENNAPQVTYLPLTDAIDPLQQRADLEAWPLRDPVWGNEAATFFSEGLQLVANNNETFGMALADLNT